MKKILLISVFLLSQLLHACPDNVDMTSKIEIPLPVMQTIEKIIDTIPTFSKELKDNDYDRFVSWVKRLDSDNIRPTEKYEIFFFILENSTKEEFRVSILYDKGKKSAYNLNGNLEKISLIIKENFGNFSNIIMSGRIDDLVDVIYFLNNKNEGSAINKIEAFLLKFAEDEVKNTSDVSEIDNIEKLFYYPKLSFEDKRIWSLEFMTYDDEKKFIEECKFSGILSDDGFLEIKKFDKKKYLIRDILIR